MLFDFAKIQGAGTVLRKFGQMISAGLLLVLLAACASGAPTSVPLAQDAAVSGIATPSASDLEYRLGSGDKLRVIVYGEQDLSGEFDVTGTGKVSLPLIGQVQATGLTLEEFEAEIGGKLQEGYLTNPKVSVEVLNYRPFYIIGEVNKSGEYPYTNGMNVLNAVAVAGGFTYRADDQRIFISRGGQEEAPYPVSQATRVLPGDIVRVPERFF